APLIAAMQVLVAAGAVMVLILFVVMLVDVRREIARARLVRFGQILGATGAAYLALVMIIAAAAPPFAAAPDSGGYYSSASTLGLFVIKRYAAAFEIAGLMLLVACVAVIAIAGKDRARPEDTHAPEEKDLEEVAAL
ncbi:MAG: NADH-quinone oxidoreductase subunit J, partial [Planctomycetota bacterium]